MLKNIIGLTAVTILLLAGCTSKGDDNVEKQTKTEVTEEAVEKDLQPKEEQQVQKGELLQAVEEKDVQKVKEILARSNATINETNDKKETPLLIATHENDIEIAKLLIDAGADINQQDAIQDSAYLYAGAQGKTEILRYMMEHTKPNQQVRNRFGGNALIPAAEKGHLDNVRLLLTDEQVDIDHQNDYGYTALIEAVALTDGSKVYQEIVQELMDAGVNQNLRDRYGKTALDYAKEQGYRKMIEILN
ncbi:ankyrin repeat domain-containing protein [Kurthia sp. YJT4]|uniref:ankyrin repeat domain-containing protein n=1 Tax=unclassified Kurthia TaxID=2644826 RepID=UPI000745E07A|nr:MULTISPECIES: ankyrin repeat domain-containing protein [unclassified Kurthia]AMA63885.1 ankyrin repeat family protein [Kurthia sp. 11kri321]WIL38639.1 ankyrin repeat domain-containing protein [Kurthia sp. YJT4]